MIAERVIAWQRRHGRHDLPWQRDRDPYRVWVSEIMLQQTQVSAVVPYYERFVARFPDVATLAAAPQGEVLAHWSGLGYYSRARNLHACARAIVDVHGGEFPRDAQRLAELPGIGRSTAAAIASLAFGERAAILDGNVKRVLCRVFGVEGWPGAPAVERVLWTIAERELPHQGLRAYSQGMMDLGATVCSRARPSCARCPLADDCVAHAQGRTSSLPAPRPRKPVPTRSVTMVLLRRGRAVLVEQRPPAGIWGGLYSLPELAADESGAHDPAALAALLAAHGLEGGEQRTLAPFTHQFTHFRLEVRPLLVEVAGTGERAATGGHGPALDLAAPGAVAREPGAGVGWLDPEASAGAALPQPVKTLLRSLADD